MNSNLSRRNFLKIGGAVLLGAGVAGWGLNRLVNENQNDPLSAPPAGAPNVILIVLDTVRAKSMSLYGYPQPTTPNLERLAKQGVLFNRAIAPASWTLQSHASLFTGQPPFNLSASWGSSLDSQYPTLAETFSLNGYDTAGFVGNLYYCTRAYGLDRGFNDFVDFPLSPKFIASSASAVRKISSIEQAPGKFLTSRYLFGLKSAEEVREEFTHWLSGNDRRRPFFAFLNFNDAHDPYISPPQYANKFYPGEPLSFVPADLQDTLDPGALVRLRAAYESSVAYLDDQVYQLVLDLEKQVDMDNTILVVTSDHGEQFGEHDFCLHGNSLYMQLLHVPLLIKYPKQIPSGLVVDRSAPQVDLASSLLELAGLNSFGHFPDNSLSRFWTAQPKDEMILSQSTLFNPKKPEAGLKRGWSVVYGSYHYIWDRLKRNERLFNLDQDIEEVENLTSTDEGRKLLEMFRTSYPGA
jgi:arylsulfatase A-like enzyme